MCGPYLGSVSYIDLWHTVEPIPLFGHQTSGESPIDFDDVPSHISKNSEKNLREKNHAKAIISSIYIYNIYNIYMYTNHI